MTILHFLCCSKLSSYLNFLNSFFFNLAWFNQIVDIIIWRFVSKNAGDAIVTFFSYPFIFIPHTFWERLCYLSLEVRQCFSFFIRLGKPRASWAAQQLTLEPYFRSWMMLVGLVFVRKSWIKIFRSHACPTGRGVEMCFGVIQVEVWNSWFHLRCFELFYFIFWVTFFPRTAVVIKVVKIKFALHLNNIAVKIFKGLRRLEI